MFKFAKRLVAIVMALALMIPAVAISEEKAAFFATVDKTTFTAGEDIVISWEADPSQINYGKGFDFGVMASFGGGSKSGHYQDLNVEYIDGTASGTYNLKIPADMRGEGNIQIYYYLASGSRKGFQIPGIVIDNSSEEQDYIDVALSKAVDEIALGEEITITTEYPDVILGNMNADSLQVEVAAFGTSKSDTFMNQDEIPYTFTENALTRVTAGVSYFTLGYESVYFIAKTLYPDFSDRDPYVTPDPSSTPSDAPTTAPTVVPSTNPTAAPTDAPTSAPTTAPTSAPTTVPTSAPTNAPVVPVVLNLDAITIGAKQSVDTVKVVSGTVAAWTSSNEKIAKVDADGKITGVKKGTATITATSAEGESDSVEVTVVNKGKGVSKIKLSKKKASIRQGDKLALKATITPADAKNKKVVWTSSNTSVATVNAKGKVKAVGIGEAVITATSSSGKTATCKITVAGAKVKKITIEGKSKMKVGETQTLIANILPEFAENKDLKWKSSSKKIATVDENGLVTALKKGTVKITVTAKDGSKVKATFAIKIKK